MGNGAGKEEKKGKKEEKKGKYEKIAVMIPPPVDPAYSKWLARDLARIYDFYPKNVKAVKPPDHYIEFMKLNGWLDLDLNDPDLAPLFK